MRKMFGFIMKVLSSVNGLRVYRCSDVNVYHFFFTKTHRKGRAKGESFIAYRILQQDLTIILVSIVSSATNVDNTTSILLRVS